MAVRKKDYSDIFDSICRKIESGMSMRKAIEGEMSSETFYKILDGDEIKAKRYARACEIRTENIFEDILDIADTKNADIIGVDKKTGKLLIDGDAINRSRLMVDARKWMLAKMMPKKYGDKMDIDHTTQGEKINIVALGSGVKPPDND